MCRNVRMRMKVGFYNIFMYFYDKSDKSIIGYTRSEHKSLIRYWTSLYCLLKFGLLPVPKKNNRHELLLNSCSMSLVDKKTFTSCHIPFPQSWIGRTSNNKHIHHRHTIYIAGMTSVNINKTFVTSTFYNLYMPIFFCYLRKELGPVSNERLGN